MPEREAAEEVFREACSFCEPELFGADITARELEVFFFVLFPLPEVFLLLADFCGELFFSYAIDISFHFAFVFICYLMYHEDKNRE